MFLVAFNNETNGRLTPFFCLSWFNIFLIERFSNGTMTEPFLPPFDDKLESNLFSWVRMKLTRNQTVPIRSGFDTSLAWINLIMELVIGMGSEWHSCL